MWFSSGGAGGREQWLNGYGEEVIDEAAPRSPPHARQAAGEERIRASRAERRTWSVSR